MDVLRHVIVLFHIIGFAITFGAWAAEAVARRFQFTRTMDYGLVLSLITGVILSAPFPADYEPNYPKIGVKLILLVIMGAILGMGGAKQRKSGQPVPRGLFIALGVLSAATAAVAVLW
ncbi:Fe-S protein [Gordonia sp. (in: high G+C Gram-positive bacteria)]|uniref:Fe-S protein n=1 Tax=Gordonia sp. (in: high G+C Gram-positive bacteria) TaxID=84139 RepID=UPI00168FFB23|nr:Fe-S protein [Gordonia sp. (in: high G+C Gram-positive bacteria)]NLG45674.1 Fe-S protein [Gordonia sp. (in: high G+C Gram-positive bacteria)]